MIRFVKKIGNDNYCTITVLTNTIEKLNKIRR